MADRFTTRIAVFVVLRNEKGEVLLQQRAGSYLAGYWDFPSGHGEYNEGLRESAVRELMEEVGVRASPEDLRLIHIEQFFMDHEYINFTFACDKWQGEPHICEPDKCSGVEFFAPDKLPEKCVNAVRAVAAAGFSDELTYSVTNQETYEDLMGELPPQ